MIDIYELSQLVWLVMGLKLCEASHFEYYFSTMSVCLVGQLVISLSYKLHALRKYMEQTFFLSILQTIQLKVPNDRIMSNSHT